MRRLSFSLGIGLIAGLAAACSNSSKPATQPEDAGGGGQDAVVAADATEDTISDAGAPSHAVTVLDRAGIGSENGTGWPNTTKAFGEFDWGQGPFAKVTLIVDLDTSCYPFERWSADPPPSGQNWPPSCDAFDRNFNAFIDDGAASPDPIPFEVMHAITPFGGPEHVEIDLTDLANARPGAHKLRVDLLSYSDSAGMVTGSNAGWTVSAHFDVTPGAAPHRVLAAIPLFTGQVVMGDPWPVVNWQVPEGAVGGRIEYRTSGHGQGPMGPRCVGPAEEFCDRRHLIQIDGTEVKNVSAYREDCATYCTLTHYGPADAGFDYCRENPGGLPASVRAPRANWCPGTMTPPFSWTDIPALSVSGPHTFSFQLTQILMGGTWLVSAIYYAYGV